MKPIGKQLRLLSAWGGLYIYLAIGKVEGETIDLVWHKWANTFNFMTERLEIERRLKK